MITKETLKTLHKNMLSNKSCGSTPKRMFANGLFTKNNWNGGDDLIRDFLSDIEDETIKNIYIIEKDDYDFHFICHVDRVCDETYATIIINGDVYYFEWYKNRGCTEVAKLNGEYLTEDEYIRLLNIIELTGYKFNY